MTAIPIHPNDRILLRDRPWIVRQVSETGNAHRLLALEALDGDRPETLQVAVPPEEPRLLPNERHAFDLAQMESLAAWVNAHRILGATLVRETWDKIKPDRKEFYGRYDILIRAFVGGELDRRIQELQRERPGLAAAFEAYEARLKTLASCLKKGGDYRFQDWAVDGKTTGGDPDAFKFFVERAWQLTREGGRVGFVVPSARAAPACGTCCSSTPRWSASTPSRTGRRSSRSIPATSS